MFQSVSLAVVPQTCNVFRITIEGYDASRVANQPCSPERHDPDERADIVDTIAGLYRSLDCALHIRFMVTEPETRFSRDPNLHPHPSRYARFNPSPNLGPLRQAASYNALEPVQTLCSDRPPPQPTLCGRLLEGKVHSISWRVK